MPRCCIVRSTDGNTLIRCEVVHADDETAKQAAKAAALSAWATLSHAEGEPLVEETAVQHVEGAA
jgi:hypothetical protein